MKKISLLILIITLFYSFSVQSQNMTNSNLEKILYVVSDSIQGNSGNWQFIIEGTLLFCVTDETHNRMRIISPIIEQEKLSDAEMQKLMEANFHTALDARYAISNNVLWAAYIHPLRELTKNQVMDAISQVYTVALTFGTTYNSTGLSFPGNTEEDINNKKNIKELNLQKNKI